MDLKSACVPLICGYLSETANGRFVEFATAIGKKDSWSYGAVSESGRFAWQVSPAAAITPVSHVIANSPVVLPVRR